MSDEAPKNVVKQVTIGSAVSTAISYFLAGGDQWPAASWALFSVLSAWLGATVAFQSRSLLAHDYGKRVFRLVFVLVAIALVLSPLFSSEWNLWSPLIGMVILFLAKDEFLGDIRKWRSKPAKQQDEDES